MRPGRAHRRLFYLGPHREHARPAVLVEPGISANRPGEFECDLAHILRCAMAHRQFHFGGNLSDTR